jgi:hypothetical protein
MDDSLSARLARSKKESEKWKNFDLEGRNRASDELIANTDDAIVRGRKFLELSKLDEDEDGDKEIEETSARCTDGVTAGHDNEEGEELQVMGEMSILCIEGTSDIT